MLLSVNAALTHDIMRSNNHIVYFQANSDVIDLDRKENNYLKCLLETKSSYSYIPIVIQKQKTRPNSKIQII